MGGEKLYIPYYQCYRADSTYLSELLPPYQACHKKGATVFPHSSQNLIVPQFNCMKCDACFHDLEGYIMKKTNNFLNTYHTSSHRIHFVAHVVHLPKFPPLNTFQIITIIVSPKWNNDLACTVIRGLLLVKLITSLIQYKYYLKK